MLSVAMLLFVIIESVNPITTITIMNMHIDNK